MNGHVLRQARERLGLTQVQAARRIGVQVDTYRKWEAGIRTPRADVAEVIEAVMTGKVSPKEEIAGLRELVSRLVVQVQDLTREVAEIRRELGPPSAR